MTNRPLQDRADDATAPEGIPDYDEGEAETVLAEWTFDETAHAAWCGRKLRTIRDRIARVKRIADEQRAQIGQFEERETVKLARDAAFFEGRLEAFHRAELARDPKAKTVPLPDGTTLRSQGGKLSVVVEDEAALIAWAEEHLLASEIFEFPAPKPKRTDIGKKFGAKANGETEPGDYPAITDDGEIVPGVTIKRGARTFTQTSPAEVEGAKETDDA